MSQGPPNLVLSVLVTDSRQVERTCGTRDKGNQLFIEFFGHEVVGIECHI